MNIHLKGLAEAIAAVSGAVAAVALAISLLAKIFGRRASPKVYRADSSRDRGLRGRKLIKIGVLALVVACVAGGVSQWYGQSQQYTVAGLDLVMIRLRPGTFTMGAAEREPGYRETESPQMQVTLTQPFWLGQTEVTQGQYEAVMGRNPSSFKGPNLPVERVNWDEAMGFCQKLTEREQAAGHLPVGYAYTLPTEAQWEYACRAGSTGSYVGDLDANAWYGANSQGTTHPVGTKEPNSWGLYDFQGNVCEWCADFFGIYPGGAVTDPKGPDSGTIRVVRGCSWSNDAANCRPAFRDFSVPGARTNLVGFRLALSPAH
jgi:formylglycine-generating enzyme required for sulfatase activity